MAALSETMVKLCKRLPKVELHAHINGSISSSTMTKLIDRKLALKPDLNVKQWMTTINKGESRTLDECFAMFGIVYQVVDDAEAAYMVTKDVICEFAADNVKYLELRSTPRAVEATGMSKRTYIDAVLRAISECHADTHLDIVVRLLLSVDRRHTQDMARETMELALEYKEKSQGVVVGLDLCGDPSKGDAQEFIPLFKEAKERGLKVTMHIAEMSSMQSETVPVVDLPPDRIGHGTFLDPLSGGTPEMVDCVLTHRTPIEVCLTSNVKCKTTPAYKDHHLNFWYKKNHPCILCTDDKGIFSTSLSEEYAIAADTFSFSTEDLWCLSYDAINYIFAGEDVKMLLREKWQESKKDVFIE